MAVLLCYVGRVLPTPCIIHPNKPNKTSGYVQLNNGRRVLYAHRVAWEKINGPIPKNMTVDHLCFNVNHMELVTRGENVRRGRRWKAQREAGTCAYGHPRAVFGRKRRNGKWYCLPCQYRHQKRKGWD